LPRGTRDITTVVIEQRVVHAIVYSPDPERQRWIERELSRDPVTIQSTTDIGDVVSALIPDGGPHPQFLVIDIDALDAGELFHLHQVRDAGWCGTIVALGHIPPSLRSSLKIARAIPPPFIDSALTDEIVTYRCATMNVTARMPVIDQVRTRLPSRRPR
jgi:hypothetical protein